jgi:hypothetical protein
LARIRKDDPFGGGRRGEKAIFSDGYAVFFHSKPFFQNGFEGSDIRSEYSTLSK